MYYTFYCIFFRILTEKLTIEETLFGQEDISCNDLAAFKFLRTYCSMITQKKIAIQSTAQYFKNENIPDEVKEIQGTNLVIRQEFLVHSHLFHGKILIHYLPPVNDQAISSSSQKEVAIVIPSMDTIHREIKNQQKNRFIIKEITGEKRFVGKITSGTKKSIIGGDDEDNNNDEQYNSADEENFLP